MELTTSTFSIFKNIFADYKEFAEWYKSTPLSDNENDVPNEKTFTLIAYEFNDCHSAFSNESFRQRFANILYTSYKEFEGTTNQINKLMEMSDTEVAAGETMITNMANIPETESTTDIESVDFISQQQKTLNKSSNIAVRRSQLSNQRIYTVKTFLNRFRSLFIRIISEPFLRLINDNL